MSIPAGIEDELLVYLQGNHPYEFGSFVTAVLANDLVGAFAAADHYNELILKSYAEFLYMKMPGRTGDPLRDWWGSYEAVKNRIADQKKAYASQRTLNASQEESSKEV